VAVPEPAAGGVLVGAIVMVWAARGGAARTSRQTSGWPGPQTRPTFF